MATGWTSTQHTTYLVVETDDVAKLQKFLQAGTGVTTSEITPVSDAPAPQGARSHTPGGRIDD